MNKADQRKRTRIIALAFVSVLLLLMYGPLAQWFIAADRTLYDQLAGGRPAKALEGGLIVSINPQRMTDAEILDEYGKILEKLQQSGVRRIVLANPPDIPDTDQLPGWSSLLASDTPTFVPARHRFADISPNDGFVELKPDADGAPLGPLASQWRRHVAVTFPCYRPRGVRDRDRAPNVGIR